MLNEGSKSLRSNRDKTWMKVHYSDLCADRMDDCRHWGPDRSGEGAAGRVGLSSHTACTYPGCPARAGSILAGAVQQEASLRSPTRYADASRQEPLILLTDMTEQRQAFHVARKMIGELQRAYVLDGNQVDLSASFGVSLYPRDGTEWEMIVKKADSAMYSVKSGGKKGVRLTADDPIFPLELGGTAAAFPSWMRCGIMAGL